jgi:hypothetical protein
LLQLLRLKSLKSLMLYGSLQAVPPPMVVGNGLMSLQMAIERQKEGISAAKVVILL